MKTITTITLLIFATVSMAQEQYFTRNGTITFFSSAPLEDITAENYNATAVLDTKTGDMEFSVLMKSFNFEKALMQEHFNENYVESELYPKATFKGKITDLGKVDFTTPGKYEVPVKGELTIHGVTKPVETTGHFDVKSPNVHGTAKFIVRPEDYNIEIPAVVREKIAKEIEVSVDVNLEPLKR